VENYVNDDGTPWIEVCCRTEDGTEVVICTMGVSRGSSWGGYVGEEQDARAISVLPELLQLLQNARTELRLLRTKDGVTPYDPTLIARIDTALAKVEG
jgi:hypothetical protein